MAKVVALRINITGIDSIVGKEQALRQVIRDVNKELRNTKDAAGYDKLGAELVAAKGQLKEVQLAQRQAVEAFKAQGFAPGSYRAIQAATKVLVERLRLMAPATSAARAEMDRLRGTIKANKEQLSAFDRELTSSQTLVGEYARGIENALAKVGIGGGVKKRLQALTAEQKKLREETRRLAPEYEKLKAIGGPAFGKVSNSIVQNTQRLDQLNREIAETEGLLKQASAAGTSLGNNLGQQFRNIAVATGLTFGAFKAVQGIKDFTGDVLELGRGFAQVNTVAQVSKEELEELTNDALDTAKLKEYTGDLEQIPGALFTIVSGTGDLALSQDILAASLDASKAGFADLNATADAGTNILNAVGRETTSITEIFDTLFATQREGVVDIQTLAKQLPLLVPSAKATGFEFREVAASLAAVTKQGVDATTATTQLDRLFTALGVPATKKNFEELGVAIFDSAGQTRPFVDIVGDVDKALDGLNPEERAEELSKLGLDKRAAKGLNVLVAGLEDLRDITQDVVVNSTGELQRELLLSANTADEVDAAFNAFKITMAQELGPAVEGAAKGLAGLLSLFTKLFGFVLRNKSVLIILAGAILLVNQRRITSIAITLKDIVVKRASVFWTALQVKGNIALSVITGVLSGRIGIVTGAQKLWNLAMASNPIGLLIVAVTALGVALVSLFSSQSKITEEMKKQAELQGEIADRLADEKQASDNLFESLQREGITREERGRLIEEINSKYGSYLGNLLTEESSLQDIARAQKKVNDALQTRIILELKKEELAAITKESQRSNLVETTKLASQLGITFAQTIDFIEELKVKGLENLDALSSSSRELVETILKDGAEARAGLTDFGAVLNPFAGGIAARSRAVTESTEQGLSRILNTTKDAEAATNRLTLFFDKLLGTGPPATKATAEGAKELEEELGEATVTLKSLREQLAKLQKARETTNIATPKGLASFKKLGTEITELQKRISSLTGRAKKSKSTLKDFTKDIADLARQLADIQAANLGDVTQRAITEEEIRYQRRKETIEDKTKELLQAESLSEAQRAEVKKTSDELAIALEIEHNNKIREIREAATEDKIKLLREERDKEISEIEGSNNILIQVQKQLQAEELKALEERFIAGNITFNQFQKEREALTTAAAARLLEIQRESIKEQLEATKLLTAPEDANQAQIDAIIGANAEILAEKASLATKLAEIEEKITAQAVTEIQKRTAAQIKAISFALNSALQIADSVKEVLDANQERALGRLDQEIEFRGNRVEQLEAEFEAASGIQRERLARQLGHEKTLQAAATKDREETAKRFAKQQQAIALIRAAINTALAVTQALASSLPPANFIAASLTAAAGAVQIGLISGQQFGGGGVIPQGGGPVVGNTHNNGGVKFSMGGQLYEVEGAGAGQMRGGELFVNRGIWRRPDMVHAISEMNYATGGKRFFQAGGIAGSAPLPPTVRRGDINKGANQQVALIAARMEEMIIATNNRIDRITVENNVQDTAEALQELGTTKSVVNF